MVRAVGRKVEAVEEETVVAVVVVLRRHGASHPVCCPKVYSSPSSVSAQQCSAPAASWDRRTLRSSGLWQREERGEG